MKKLHTKILSFLALSVHLFFLTNGWGQTGPYQVYEGCGSQALPTQGGTWAATSTTFNTSGNGRSGLYSLIFDAAGDIIRTPQIATPGVFSFWYKRSNNTTAPSFTIETSTDNSTWTSRGTVTDHNTNYKQYTIDLAALGLSNVYVRIKDTRASGTHARYIDDISWTSTTASENTTLIQGISGTVNLLSGVTYMLYDFGGVNDQYSSSQSTAPLVLNPPSGYIVNANFTTLGTEASYDFLKIYNGNSTSSTAFHTGSGFSGSSAPGAFSSTHTSGAITMDFTSDSGANGSGFVATITTAIAPTCYTPTTLTSSTITYQTATITWAAPTLGTSPAGYEYEVRTSGAAGSGATGLVASGTTTAPIVSASITGLSAATAYTYYVRSSCGGGDYSVWSGAGTFVSGCDIPNNPGTISVSNASSTGFTLTYAAASPAPTAYTLFFATGTSAAATTIPTLVNGTSYTNGTAYTLGGNSYTCITNSSVSPIALSSGISNTQYNYYLFSRNTTNSCFGAPYYSSAVATSTVTCAAAPTAPVNSSIMSNSATVSWTASVVGGGFGTINYSLEVYTDAAYTTPISGSPFSMGTTVTQNISGLTASTKYYYRIVANNGTCNSAYLTGNFTTLCDAISSLPWTEGFEGVTVGTTVVGASTALPSCWNSQSTQWTSSDATAYNTAKTGTKYLRYAYSSTNAYMWTPGFQLTAGVSYDFSFYAQGDGYATWLNDIFVNTSVSSTGATQLTPTYSPTGSGTIALQSYNLVKRTFVPSTTGVYYFAVRGNQPSSSPWYMAFDDFKLEETPSCIEPTAPTISAITNAGATLSWTAPSTVPGSGYDVYYSIVNTAPTSGTSPTETVATGTSIAIAGLTANTTYYAWVRSNCGSGDESTWVASASFTTQCDPISSLPWTEGFESLTTIGTTEFTDCWFESTGPYWTSLDAAEDTYNDPRTGDKYIGCDYGVTDQRIWTPGFQLTAGVSYDFSTYFVGDGYSGWDGSILSNTSQNGTGETVLGSPFVSSSITTLEGTDYTLIKRSFIPSTTGVYYFGIKISANYDPYGYIGFDDFKLELTPAPTITTVSSSVACGGSTLVTITGTNLSSASSVKIGGTTILPLVTNTATQITATVTTAFSGTVEVVTASGTTTSASSISYTTAPVLTINTAAQTNCSNVSNGSLTTITSTVGDYDTYTWSPTTGVSGDVTNGWTFNPTATTSYVLTASNSSGCSNTISKSITVNSAPSAITLTPAATTGVCLGDVKSIVASGGDVNTSLPNYSFSSTSGTFTPITGGTSVSAVQTDDIIASAIPIGFTFNYNGSTYSNVYPSSNGFLSLNSSAPSNSSATNGLTSVSSTIAPLIAPLWDDLDGSTGSASYLTSGTVGNRIFTFEWLNWEWNYSANSAVISFQVKLYEETGKVEFVYRQEGNAVNTNSSGASIGLTGSTGTYWSLNNSSSSPTASKTSETSTIVTKPATGQIFSFTPPPSPTKSWTPTATLFIDAAGTTAYAGYPTTVYAKPTANTTYTATATNAAGCSVSSSVTFNVSTPSSMALGANDYVWRGKVDTDWNTASNWVVFDGSNYATATTVPTATQNIYIPQNGVCVANQPNTGSNNIASSLITIEPSATLTMGSGTLAASGNFVNNGTFVPGTGTVNFNGSGAQTITGTTTFNNLSLDNTAGLTLNNPVTVSNNLTMTAGNITTNATNMLTIGNSAPATLTWTSGKVVGPMKRWMAAATNSGSASSLFPVGSVTRNAKVNLEYTIAPTAAGYLEANYIPSDPTSTVAYPVPLTDQYNYLLENVDANGYWEIAPSASNGVAGGKYTLTVQADGISPLIDFQNYRIIKSPMPHSDWILQGSHLAGSGSNSDFTVSRTDMSDFSFFALATPVASLLPVELVSFAANCEDNNTVAVNWTTASEHNSDYFIVEKSRNGITWNELKKIEAAGYSNSLLNYSVVDASDISGTVYYRLKQVDLDGASHVYDIVSTNCSLEKEVAMLAYPNPSNGQFTLKIENAQGGKYNISFKDLHGKEIDQQFIQLENGTTILKLNPANLQPSVYLLQLIQDGNVLQQQKLVVN